MSLLNNTRQRSIWNKSWPIWGDSDKLSLPCPLHPSYTQDWEQKTPSIGMHITSLKLLFCRGGREVLHSLELQQMAGLCRRTQREAGHRLASMVQVTVTPSCTVRLLSEALHSTGRRSVGNPWGFMVRHCLWRSGPSPIFMALDFLSHPLC